MSLIDKIKSKLAIIACVILSTMLVLKTIEVNKLKDVESSFQKQVELNQRLSETNERLLNEVKTKPPEYITITREVEKEVCKGIVRQEAIKALPSKKEVHVEKGTADIDDRLPDDLIQLLK